MDDRLKKYLTKRGAKPLDPNVLKSYITTMTEKVIPQIVNDIKQSEQLVAELRFSSSATSRSKNKHD